MATAASLRERLTAATGSDRNFWISLNDVVSERQAGASFSHGLRGQTLCSLADFSGGHANSLYSTYAFLIFDLEKNRHTLLEQRAFRKNAQLGKRRISFKALNDKARQRAMVPFLHMANGIEGTLYVFAISKELGALFGAGGLAPTESELLSAWKPGVHEHLLRVVQMGAIVGVGSSSPGQDVLWIADQDEIASNELQLRALTKLIATVWGNILHHPVGHLRVGTTWSDDGSLALEDLVAIPDLAAGALCESLSAMQRQGCLPVPGIINRMPRMLSKKTERLMWWLSLNDQPLRRQLIVVGGGSSPDKLRISRLELPYIPEFISAPTRR